MDFAGVAGGERVPPAPLGWYVEVEVEAELGNMHKNVSHVKVTNSQVIMIRHQQSWNASAETITSHTYNMLCLYKSCMVN